MSQSMWPLAFVGIFSRRLLLLGTLLSLSIPLAVQTPSLAALGWPFHSDRDLINKLYTGDFAHISDDNFGRMDLEAVFMAFRTDKNAGPDKCNVLGENQSAADVMARIAKYIQYLNTDRQTGTFPSAQFMTLSVLSAAGDSPGFWALNPNMLAMAMEIHERGCASERVQRIRGNMIQLLEERIAWHAVKDHSKEIGLMKQSIAAVKKQAFETAVSKDMELPAQSPAMRQLGDIEARGAQVSDCEYGPTNPDSTGSETVTFWYKDVPIPMAEILKLSRKHPLARYGDIAVIECPRTLWAARHKLGESQGLGQSRIEESALPAAHLPLTVMGKYNYAVYQNVKKSWMSYQATHDPRDQQQAIAGKTQLLSGPFGYEKACEKMKAANQPPTNVHCQIAQQLADEFRDIPMRP